MQIACLEQLNVWARYGILKQQVRSEHQYSGLADLLEMHEESFAEHLIESLGIRQCASLADFSLQTCWLVLSPIKSYRAKSHEVVPV
jgi:hypothetical protein